MYGVGGDSHVICIIVSQFVLSHFFYFFLSLMSYTHTQKNRAHFFHMYLVRASAIGAIIGKVRYISSKGEGESLHVVCVIRITPFFYPSYHTAHRRFTL